MLDDMQTAVLSDLCAAYDEALGWMPESSLRTALVVSRDRWLRLAAEEAATPVPAAGEGHPGSPDARSLPLGDRSQPHRAA
jgi:hypothetical protein